MMESTTFLFLLFILFLSLSPPSTYQQSSSNNNKTASQPANTSKAAVNIHHEDRLQRWQKRLEKMEASQPTPSTFSADVCHCDLSPNHCDVDCCCDQRCHRLEKLAFSRCKSSVDISNDLEEQRTFCHSSAHIFGRKRLYLDRQSSRLLCIARTNSAKGELSYANRPTITDFSPSLSSLVLAYSKFKWSPAANSKTGNSFFTNSRASSSSSTADEDQVKAVLEYRTGAPVLVLTAAKKLTASPSGNGSTSSGEQWRLEQWRLPAALGGSQLCNHRALVGYMHDYQADCWRPFSTCKGEEDENDDFSRLRFHYYDFVAGEYRPVKVELEKGGDKNLKVTFDSTKGTCSGVIASRHFTVYHRGIYGISRVVLRVRHFPPISVTAAAEVRQVKQHFAVHFRWEEDDAMMISSQAGKNATNSNSTAAAKSNGTIHSASPSSSSSSSSFGGYHRGQPLLFAQQQQQTGNESSSSSYAVLPLEKSTLISTYRGGSCGGGGNEANQNVVLAPNPFRFGVNQLTSCRLQLRVPSMARKAICERLEAAIAKVVSLLFDGSDGKNASTLLVSIFGNGTSTFNATSKEKDWLPVLVLPSTTAAVTDPESSATQLTALGCNESSPFSLGTTATNWQVFYARVGPKASPKLKVVAVTVQSSGQPLGNYLEVSCPPPPQAATISKNTNNSAAALPLCSAVLDTELTAAVDFVDVTAGPAVPDYAPAPSVRFELPSDFFYPFTASSGVSAIISSRFVIIIHSLFIFSAILGGRMF